MKTLKKCERCGPNIMCKVDIQGNHTKISYSMLRAWAISLVMDFCPSSISSPLNISTDQRGTWCYIETTSQSSDIFTLLSHTNPYSHIDRDHTSPSSSSTDSSGQCSILANANANVSVAMVSSSIDKSASGLARSIWLACSLHSTKPTISSTSIESSGNCFSLPYHIVK